MITKNYTREKLSVAIITLNAQRSLEACLQSVSFADEIVIVDAGSDDATQDIAKTYGAKVFMQPWLGFGKQKQFAVACTTWQWVLCVDADERITDTLKENIMKLLVDPKAAAYRLSRRNRFLGKWLSHGEGYPDYILRLIDKTRAGWSNDAIHEKIETTGKVGFIAGDLLHESEAGLNLYMEKQHRYTILQAQTLFAEGKRVNIFKIFFSPIVRFVKFYFIRQGFRDGLPGFIHIVLGCFNSFMKYAQLYELQTLAQEKKRAS